MKTAMQELIDLIPDAKQIKDFIHENDADEKMLDQWLHERIYLNKDWIEKEKQQIIDAYEARKRCIMKYPNGEQYYNSQFKQD